MSCFSGFTDCLSSWITAKDCEDLAAGECPDCCCLVDCDGESVEPANCAMSPVMCDTCGFRPCDESC